MFSIKFDEDYSLSVADAGRGRWSIQYNDGVSVLEGFDGENTCTIQTVGRQDGTYFIMVTYASVDGDVRNTSSIVKTQDLDEVADEINKLIKSFSCEASLALDAEWRGRWRD